MTGNSTMKLDKAPKGFKTHCSKHKAEIIALEEVKNKVKCKNCGEMVDDEEVTDVQGDLLCDSCYQELGSCCEECGEHFYTDNMTEIDGILYCTECRDNNFFLCDDCKEYHNTDNMNTINDDWHVCPDCLENYSYCEDCQQYFDSDNVYSVEGDERTVCKNCYENYHECGDCGYVGHQDDMSWCDSCDCYYCENCGCDCDDGVTAGRHRVNYSEQKPSIEHMVGLVPNKIDFGRLVGVELEVEGGNGEFLNDKLDCRVGISHDGSLRNGVEIQTPPASFEKLAKLLNDTTKTLKENDFHISTRCGMHIHLDATDFKFKYSKIARIVKTYYAIEDVFYKILPDSRRHSTYCYPLRDKFSFDDFNPKSLGILEKIWYGKGNGHLAKMPDAYQISDWDKRWKNIVRGYKKEKYNNSRYLGINIHSIFFRGTLEIRHHSGTLNAKKIFHWINFNSAIVNYALTKYDEEYILKLAEVPAGKKKLTAVASMLKLNKTLKNYLLNRYDKFSNNGAEEEFPF